MVGDDRGGRRDLVEADAGAGRHDLTGRERRAAPRAVVRQPGERQQRIAQHARPGPGGHRLAVHRQRDLVVDEVEAAPVHRRRAADEGAMRAVVGHQARHPDLQPVVVARVDDLDRRMHGGDGVRHLLAAVGGGAGRQVAAEPEGELGLDAAHVELAAAQRRRAVEGEIGEDAAAERTVGAQELLLVEGGAADLPADRAQPQAARHLVLDAVAVVDGRRPDVLGDGGDRRVRAPRLDQQRGGPLHRRVGDHGVASAMMARRVDRNSSNAAQKPSISLCPIGSDRLMKPRRAK